MTTKTLYRSNALILICIFIFLSFEAKSQNSYDQLAGYYSIFDGIELSTNFLLNKGFIDPVGLERSKIIWDNEYSGYVITDPLEWKFLYQKLQRSDVSYTPLLTELTTFWDAKSINLKTNTIIPIGIINISGEYLNPELIEESFDENIGKINTDVSFESVKIFSVSNLQETVYHGNLTFMLNPQLYFSNTEDQIEGVEIDFDDGNGYQYFSFTEQNIPVSYTIKGQKSIRYRLLVSNDTLLSYSKLDVKVIEPETPDYSKQIVSGSGGQANKSIAGGVYETVLGCDNKLDKPVIIVEGFDPLKDRQPNELIEKYKDLGVWENLSASGYDLVALKFNNNHELIENNAQVLKTLINEINIDKEGHFENIIIGESMGGLVTRVALAQMEADGIDHEVGLYISFDAPHKGANIPLGIQHFGHDALDITFIEVVSFILKVFRYTKWWGFLLDGVVNGINDVEDIVSSNNSAAARQMLIRHRDYPNGNNPDYLSFQTFLSNAGYPGYSRNITLINGSDNAQQQWDDDGNGLSDLGQSMIDEQVGCSCCGFKANMNVWVSPVNISAKVSDIEIRVQVPAPLPCIQIKTTDKDGNGTFDDKPWDISPGGYNGQDIDVGLLGLDDYFQFSFVPTVSSIDLDQSIINQPDGSSYYNNSSWDVTRRKAYIVQNNLTPFDDIYSNSQNSFHVNGESFYKSDGSEEAIINKLESIEEREIMHEQMYLQNKVIPNGWSRDFEANTSITAGNNVNPLVWADKEIETSDFIIESGADVTFTAGSEITLSPGFHTQNGSAFLAGVASGNGTCNQPNAKVVSSEKASDKNYYGIFPLPEIGIYKSPDNEQLIFDVINYSSSKKGISYKWILMGEGIEINSNQKSFTATNLKSGQYSVISTINNIKSKSKVFIIPSNHKPLNKEDSKGQTNGNLNNDFIIYPNPSSGEFALKLHIEIDSPLKVSIVDLNGRIIKNLSEKFRPSGEYTEIYDISGLKPGYYLIRIEANNTSVTKKIIISGN